MAPEPPPDVAVRFDYILDEESTLAQTGVPVPATEFITGTLPTAAEVRGTAGDWDAPADRLDFALLRLGFAVPQVDDHGVSRERGMYDLPLADYAFASSPLPFIVQHPLCGTQKVTWIRKAVEPNGPRTRIRYAGNTLDGSSGSAVIDPRGRLVALHHYSIPGRSKPTEWPPAGRGGRRWAWSAGLGITALILRVRR